MTEGRDQDDDAQDPRTVKALADAAALTGVPCRKCGGKLSGHDAVFCLVLGYKGAPHCLPFIADHMQEPLASLRERALAYIRHHDCFAAAWRHADDVEGASEPARPGCWFGDDACAHAETEESPGSATTEGAADETWDAGDMGCGDLVLELRLRLASLPAGALLDLRATDPGAPTDLPAWCTMTGHGLVAAEHPNYRIRRRP